MDAALAPQKDKNAAFFAALRAEGIIAAPEEPEVPQVQVYDDLVWAWNAFWRLSSSRDVGFDRPNRIKVSEIKAFADLKQLSPHKALELLFYVDALDDRWMEHAEDARLAAEEERKKKQKDHTPAKPRAQR